MSIISGINLLILFLCDYPGTLSTDSINQISQILSNSYSNHHPFYHTMIIKIFISVGMKLFHSLTAGIALYSVFSVIFMSSCFSLVIVTLYQMRIAYRWIVLCLIWYVIMPYHILFSFTMWKDVIFGGMLVILITALFRIICDIGKNNHINYILLVIGCLGECLLRSNGWTAFLMTTIVFVLVFRKSHKKITRIFFIVLITSYILKHPVLAALGVKQPDFIESLSIPAQQISRVVTDCGELTKEQYDLLQQIISVERIPKIYNERISDPIKNAVRDKNNQSYLEHHKTEYLKLWIELGLKHPVKYIESFIDQTCGYWNGGYSYDIFASGIVVNDMGISKIVYSNILDMVKNMYLWCFLYIPVLQIFTSIGFHVWLTIGLGAIAIINRKKEAFLSVPIIAIIFTLLIATPVYCEFRYAYSVFTSIPIIFFAVLHNE